MKNLLGVLIVVACLMPVGSSAQFLKKLQKAVTESVENAAIDQAANTAADKTAQAIDASVDKAGDAVLSIFKKKDKKKKRKKKRNEDPGFEEDAYDENSNIVEDDPEAESETANVKVNTDIDPASLPGSYRFDWLYTLQLNADGNSMNMDYYLQPGADYFGARPDMKQTKSAGNIIMVMDIKKGINVIFMDMSGRKMAMPSSVSVDTQYNSDEVENSENFSFREIGTKKILGYPCKGYEMENDEMKSTVYVTKKAPVSFTQLFSGSKNKPEGYNSNWFNKLDGSLVMEITMKNKEDGTVTTMKCVALKKKSTVINTADYQFMNIKIPMD